MRTVQIRDQTARSVQSDLDLHCPQKTSCVVISKERVKQCGKKIQNARNYMSHSKRNTK